MTVICTSIQRIYILYILGYILYPKAVKGGPNWAPWCREAQASRTVVRLWSSIKIPDKSNINKIPDKRNEIKQPKTRHGKYSRNSMAICISWAHLFLSAISTVASDVHWENYMLLPFKLNGLWSWWQFCFRFWTK